MAITKLSSTRFKVNLGFISIESEWEIDEIQKKAAWEMYVELATRITTIELQPNEGLLREALNSLYSIFATTREILKRYGPSIATPGNPKDTTFGHLAVGILNKILRPTLSKWHPILLDWEQKRPLNVSITEHESHWEHKDDLRKEINEIRLKLLKYADVLGMVAGVSNLIKV